MSEPTTSWASGVPGRRDQGPPPVTADHTPERLSAEEREVLILAHHQSWHVGCPGCGAMTRDFTTVNRMIAPAVERILAAHMADVKARLAAVEALADEYAPAIKRQLECSDRGRCGCTFCEFMEDLHAALHPDPRKQPDNRSQEHI
jgi:hypothetical protein